jgi:predicted metal-dependent phosphoesterase TrpH
VDPVWEAGPLCRFTLADQVEVIHAAGGVAVLAHPLYRCAGELLTADHITALVEMGIDGLEVYHRYMDEQARAHFQALADQFKLLVTGGSDEHGWSPDLPLLGTAPVTRAMVEALRAAARKRSS